LPDLPVWQWNGTAWVQISGGGGGGSELLVSDTPPTGAADNSLWFEADTGILYIRYFDGDSSQWLMTLATPGPVGPPGPSGAVYVQDAPPVGAADNSLWLESDSGLLFVRYNDGDSAQWIQIRQQ
jgi:hypothetical protein